MTATRMISGLLWKHLKGSRFGMGAGYEAAPPASKGFFLTTPQPRLVLRFKPGCEIDEGSGCGRQLARRGKDFADRALVADLEVDQ